MEKKDNSEKPKEEKSQKKQEEKKVEKYDPFLGMLYY